MSPAPATPLTVGTTWGFHPEAIAPWMGAFGGFVSGACGPCLGWLWVANCQEENVSKTCDRCESQQWIAEARFCPMLDSS